VHTSFCVEVEVGFGLATIFPTASHARRGFFNFGVQDEKPAKSRPMMAASWFSKTPDIEGIQSL